ncbi:Aste57867_3855 [Aphanomyces stellatus]|uniref:Aste57867_3855 protein n=1 Tax=Aphanomyces stellatus TaxID=120398 RepID=A0A485KAF6_9STRA|nr:hypothetical protein As57867_003844 [Aphanomyces stellatus]VFT81001.1 Aste57867_3855 [Aphanomyces stellatus]
MWYIHLVDYATTIIDGNGPLAWTLDADESDLRAYKAEDPLAPPGTRSWAWTIELQGTLDDVAEMLATDIDDPDEYREYCAKFHMDALDGVRLYCLASGPKHYVGVHWTVNELPGLIKNKDVCFVKNRDWCFLEAHSAFELPDGRKGYVRALSSVELSCCPDLKPALGFIRANYHRSGYVFVESKARPGYLDVTQLQQIDFRGTLTDLFASIEVSERKREMRELDQKLRVHRLSRSVFLGEHMLVASTSRSTCNVCRHKFGLLGRKHRCRKCGEVVCANCSRVWALKVAGIPSSLRICSPCAMAEHMRRPSGVLLRGTSSCTAPSATDGSSDLDETASVMSSSSSTSYVGAKLRHSPDSGGRVRQSSMAARQPICMDYSPRPITILESDDGFSQYSETDVDGSNLRMVKLPPVSHDHGMIKIDFSHLV